MADPSTYEKRGAARWAKCPSCDEWVHVSETILAMATVPLRCPGCEHVFPASEAVEIV